MKKAKKLKALVLIDGSNTYFAQKLTGKWLDWVRVKKYLESIYKISEFRYYLSYRPNDQRTAKFILKLKRIGFTLVTKPIKIIIDQTGARREKANFDVEITADALLSLKKYTSLILFSGDSDFLYLRNILMKNKKKVEVFSTRKTLAWELKLKVKYYFFEDIRDLTKEKDFDKL